MRAGILPRVELTEQDCWKAFQSWRSKASRRIYKSAYQRYGKKLPVKSVLEQGLFGGRDHFHLLVECPAYLTDDEFLKILDECWRQTKLGHRLHSKQAYDPAGWLGYMLKVRTKSHLDYWGDALDLFSKKSVVEQAN